MPQSTTPSSVFVGYESFSTTSLPSFLPPTSTSYTFNFIIHALFTHSFSSLLTTCPYHLNPNFAAWLISSSISPSTHYTATLTPHIHLVILISANFSFFTGQVSPPCNIKLCTQLVLNLPLIRAVSILADRCTSCLSNQIIINTLQHTNNNNYRFCQQCY